MVGLRVMMGVRTSETGLITLTTGFKDANFGRRRKEGRIEALEKRPCWLKLYSRAQGFVVLAWGSQQGLWPFHFIHCFPYKAS